MSYYPLSTILKFDFMLTNSMNVSAVILRHLNFEVCLSWKGEEAYRSLLGFGTGCRGNALLHKMVLKGNVAD